MVYLSAGIVSLLQESVSICIYASKLMNIFVLFTDVPFHSKKSNFTLSCEAMSLTSAPACIVVSSCLLIGCKMAALEMPANGEASHNVGEDIIHKALDSVEDRLQKVSPWYFLPLMTLVII